MSPCNMICSWKFINYDKTVRNFSTYVYSYNELYRIDNFVQAIIIAYFDIAKYK